MGGCHGEPKQNLHCLLQHADPARIFFGLDPSFAQSQRWARCSASLGNSSNSSQTNVLACIYLWLEEIPYTPSIAIAERTLAFFYRCKLFVDGSDLDIAYQCLVEG